ncbi:Modification methylase HaeIII [termite gut metagenome]|uniref:DNA (cytosine-5-)-methyltransferase n=1 Tax=termite gut metagenome TaxID=433724 RepID=A0A5J4S6F4_9ZZZZ
MNRKIPILSFFTGGGFLDMGFINAGFNVVWTNEYDLAFAQLYSEGITSWKQSRKLISKDEKCKILNTNSIRDISAETIVEEAFGSKKFPLFGVIGGPPCQDFSINGNLVGFNGDRGSLTDTYLYKILELKPAFFVMENVTGLIRVKRNANHFFDLLKVMEQEYLIDWSVLNSLKFGVPQSRDRVFIVGLNKSYFDTSIIQIDISGKWFPFLENIKYVNPKKDFKWAEATDFGSKNIEKPQNLPIDLCVESYLVSKEDEKIIPNSTEFFKLKNERKYTCIKEGDTQRPSFKRLHRYKYSPTACYGNNEIHLHPYQNRRLSVRETLRIQSVEDTYILSTPNMLSKKFKMIGNGVPVLLAEGVAKTLHTYIDKLINNDYVNDCLKENTVFEKSFG